MRSRLLWSASLVTLVVPMAAAQTAGRFEGRLVREGTGTPLADASVTVVGLSGSTRTDSDGRFTLAPAPQVPFQMVVVLSGGQVARPVVVGSLQEGTANPLIAYRLERTLSPSLARSPKSVARPSRSGIVWRSSPAVGARHEPFDGLA
jgi:Carboxypeptidase regulatory-like domain